MQTQELTEQRIRLNSLLLLQTRFGKLADQFDELAKEEQQSLDDLNAFLAAQERNHPKK